MKQTRLSINTVRLIIYTLGSRKSSHGLIASRAEMADNLKTLLEFSISLSPHMGTRNYYERKKQNKKPKRSLATAWDIFFYFSRFSTRLAGCEKKRKKKKWIHGQKLIVIFEYLLTARQVTKQKKYCTTTSDRFCTVCFLSPKRKQPLCFWA